MKNDYNIKSHLMCMNQRRPIFQVSFRLGSKGSFNKKNKKQKKARTLKDKGNNVAKTIQNKLKTSF